MSDREGNNSEEEQCREELEEIKRDLTLLLESELYEFRSVPNSPIKSSVPSTSHSLPTSPKQFVSVRLRATSFEKLLNMSGKAEYDPLARQHAGHKGWATSNLNRLTKHKNENTLSQAHLDTHTAAIKDAISHMKV